jgi:hypothetical protein
LRKLKQKLLVLTLAFLLPLQTASGLVFASNAPVQFTIPDTTLTIRGFAAPGAFVQIIDGDALIGTVLADENGIFEKDFPAMTAGLHNIRISYDDSDGLPSDPISQTINVRAQSDTAVEYFLPPTLNVSPVSLVEGELVTFSGSSLPNAIVEILVDGGNTILRPQSDATGRYSITVDTTGYYFGEHSVIASASQGGLTSFQTLKKPFIVLPVESNAGQDNDGQGELLPPAIEVSGQSGEVEIEEDSALLRGTAPPNTQVIIYLDGEPIGSTFSNALGVWFFNISITSPTHDVRAVACFGSQCSDFSNLIKLVFKGDIGRCSEHRFWLSDYRFWEVQENKGIDLNVTGVSGTPPYEVLVDWGDTVTERFNRNTAQSYNIHHVYDLMGQYNGRIVMVDDAGCEYERLFSVHVVEQEFDYRWFGLIGPALIVILIVLHRRHRIHRKKLILAR